ncbi:MAG: hypothetical protein AAFX80_18230 [Cyanobacteria bacterium J06639_18]
MDIEETNNSASQSNQPGNIVFRLSPELALQLIEHMENTSCDDDDLLETPRNTVINSTQLKIENQIEGLSQGNPEWN